MTKIYDRLINQYKFKNQKIFLAKFDKQDEDDRVLAEIDFYIIRNINHNSTESDINKIDVSS